MGNINIKQRLTALIQKGISFEANQDKLSVKGDLAILSEEDKDFLKSNKPAIISLIESQTKTVPVIQKMKEGLPKRLSFSQQGLWLLDKINNGSNHYNLTATFKLTGTLNYEALNQTFLTILERHESLRSYFLVNSSNEPVQKIQPINDFQIVVEEIKGSSENKKAEIIQKIEEAANRSFDLTKDLLLNVRLLKLKKEEYILVVTMHHIASDGWSMGILTQEFNSLYNSYSKGLANPLPELKIQYSDYAHWQRTWLQGKNLETHTNYWKQQLSELPVLHNLPLDRQRPLIQSFRGDIYNSFIDKKTLNALNKICRSEAASLFMGIQAAFSTLLARYSNEKDIVIGSPIANRGKAEIADLVGFFMNILVLRSDFSENPSFKTLLGQSKKMLKEAYEYQQMPFDKIVEELKVTRSLSHNPLFQILLTLHNNQEGELAISDLLMEPVNYSKGKSAKYDLSLNVTEQANGLNLSWEYNTDLFDETTITKMATHFNSLLIALLDQPDENVFKLNIIDKQETAELFQYLEGEKIELNEEDHTIKFFDKQLKTKSKEIAIICNDVSYTYEYLGEQVNSIAHFLSEHGVGKDDKVGVCLLRSVDLVATIFACLKIGAIYIPLDPIYPAERINQIVHDGEPKCIVTQMPLKVRYLNTLPDEKFAYLENTKSRVESKTLLSNCFDAEIAYIIFTSGSTGKPKGIEITHENLNNLLKGFDVSFADKSQQRWLAQTSMNFDISVLELIWTISRGQTIVLQQTNPFKLLAPDRLNPAKKIDFSVMFFGADKSKDRKYDLLMETAKFADENGFKAIWTPERHFGEFGGAFPSPSVLSSALAVLTKNIKIRSGSVVLPLHDTVRVAEEWALIDNLSKGRIGMSIASGWQPDDFVFSGADFANRHQIMRNKIAELKDLWKGNPITRKNGIDKDFKIKIRPRPIQKDLPLWITAAGSPETFRYAGEIGANLLTHMLGQSQEKLASNIAVYHQALSDNGFKIEDKKVSLMLHTYMDETEQLAFGISEQPFKEYLESSIKLMAPLAKEAGIDIDTQKDLLIDMAYRKFSKENTLIGSPESCQKMLFSMQSIGVTEVACLVDFGVESEKVLAGLEKILEAKNLYQSHSSFIELLNTDNQKTELDLIDEYKVTHVQMTPSQSKLVLDLYHQTEGKNLSSVQHWFIGGEALNSKVVEGLSAITSSKFYNMYGPTETTVWSAWREITSKDIRIGAPIINTNLLLLNEFEQQVPVGIVGELYIGGLGLAKAYYNNAALSKERFRYLKNGHYNNHRFYKTGDLMKLNANGTFEYIGRKDNQIKVNGYRVELEEIEKTIEKVEGVKSCKVVPIADNNVTTLSAYVIKEDIVHGDYQMLPAEKQARAFRFADGSTVYHQSNRQLAMLYQEIIEDGIYFKHGISIPENGLVLDIGANIGTFSIDVSQKRPNATVIAFEPIPQIFSALKKNFEHRQIKGRVLNYGVSNKKETATFFYYPEMAGMSGRFADKETIVDAVEQYIEYDKQLLNNNNGNHLSVANQEIVKSAYKDIDGSDEVKEYLASLYKAEEVECQLTTVSDVIDELNIQSIDLLKLDVEKSECLVLEGIRSEHWPMIRQLAVEVDGDHNLKIILDLLQEKNYTVNVDTLVLSDTNLPNEENTYMLYAINEHAAIKQNETSIAKSQVNEGAIRDFLQPRLPEYMIPKHLLFVPLIPLMGNGKVDMVKLKELKPSKPVAKKITKLTNKTELAIYQIWCSILNKESIPYQSSIFEAGGNSIEIVLLHEKLQTAFNVNFSLVELFRNPTISQQAKLIKDAGPQKNDIVQKAFDKGKSRRKARTKRAK